MVVTSATCSVANSITAKWAETTSIKASTYKNTTKAGFYFISTAINIPAGGTVSIGGFCMQLNNDLLPQFNLANSIHFGVDLYPAKLSVTTAPKCGLFCGNGVCDAGERANGNCPIDCDGWVCPLTRRRLSKAFGNA